MSKQQAESSKQKAESNTQDTAKALTSVAINKGNEAQGRATSNLSINTPENRVGGGGVVLLVFARGGPDWVDRCIGSTAGRSLVEAL